MIQSAAHSASDLLQSLTDDALLIACTLLSTQAFKSKTICSCVESMTHEASFAHRSDLSALILQPSSTADGVERHVDTASISNLQGDPELDFLSARFNAEKALATPGLQPPVPDEAPYDNVAAFRKHLPADIPDSLSNMPHVPRNEVRSGRRHSCTVNDQACDLYLYACLQVGHRMPLLSPSPLTY